MATRKRRNSRNVPNKGKCVKYTFCAGSKLPEDKAQEVGEYLTKLSGKKHSVTARDVLTAARPKSSPLHDLFEWDDSVAAEKYRFEQARHLIRSVNVVYRDVPEFSEPIRAFVTIRDSSLRSPDEYVNTRVVMTDKVLTKSLLKKALAEAESWTRRYRQFEQLSDIFAVIEATRKRLLG